MTRDAAIRVRIERFISTVWAGLGSYRDADITRFVNVVLPVVLGAQQQVAALTDAYLAALAASVLGTPVRETGVKVKAVTGEALRGVSPQEVYRRPGIQVWTALSLGKTFTQAVSEGLERALDIARTDLQLVKTHTARRILEGDRRVVGHQRVVSGKGCSLCHKAAGQRYTKANLQPIHDNCDCGVRPIYARAPVSQADQQEAAEDVEVIVHEHGELGPVLAVKGQNFTGPHDI